MKGLHPSDRLRRRPRTAATMAALAYTQRFPTETALTRHEAAYREGRELATGMLKAVAIRNQSGASWSPEHGPDPSWSYARGLADVLLPVFENTTRLMNTTAGRKFAELLRQGLLDDLRYHAEAALERAERPYQFLPYSKEW